MARMTSLKELRQRAERGDVSFETRRARIGAVNPMYLVELAEIEKLGHRTNAKLWLISRRPNQMVYGTASFEERLTLAREAAAKAGTTIEIIGAEDNLEDLLDAAVDTHVHTRSCPHR